MEMLGLKLGEGTVLCSKESKRGQGRYCLPKVPRVREGGLTIHREMDCQDL